MEAEPEALRYWPEPRTAFTMRNEVGKYWALHTGEDGHTAYYWTDDPEEAHVYWTASDWFLDTQDLDYSGPATIVEWELTQLSAEEVIV